MKKQLFTIAILPLSAMIAITSCTGSNGNSKRDTTLTSGGDASTKDTLLDRGKAGDTTKRDTGSRKPDSVRK